MNVSVNINRRDLFGVGLFSLPRSRGNWYFMAVLGCGIFAFLLFREHKTSALSIILAAFASVTGALGGLLGGFIANSAQMLLMPDRNSGVRGIHEFSLSPTGMHERTAVNDSQFLWTGIQSIVKVGGYMIIHINNYSAYVIPRRAFPSTVEFEEFFEHAVSCWRLARKREDIQHSWRG